MTYIVSVRLKTHRTKPDSSCFIDCLERDALFKVNMPMLDEDSRFDEILRQMKGCDPKIKPKMMREADRNVWFDI